MCVSAMEHSELLLLTILILCSLPSPGCTNKYYSLDGGPKHLLVAPSQFIAGVSNKLCISRFQSATHGIASAQIEILKPSEYSGANVTRKLISKTKKIFPEGNGGCLHLFIPKTSHRKAILRFRMSFEKLKNYKVNSRKLISILQDASLIVVQTNKPIYRVGETVQFRILQLKTDLTPIYAPIFRVHILAPPDVFGGPVKIAQWSNLTTQMGIWQQDYKLNAYAQLGEWRIVVESRNPAVASTEKIFQVTDYALPKFYITVDHQSNILRSHKQLLWTVCARYMYGEAVRGILYIKIKSDSYDSQILYFKNRINNTNGCYNHTARTRAFGFDSTTGEFPKLVIADISFQEDGTKIWKNTSVTSHIRNNVVNMEFINNNGDMYKQGLLYSIDVRVTDWDSKAVPRTTVEFCNIIGDDVKANPAKRADDSYRNLTRHTLQIVNTCEIGITNNDGTVTFVFTIPLKQYSEQIELKAKIIKHTREDFELSDMRKKPIEISLVLYSWGNKSNINMDIGMPMNVSTRMEPGMEKVFPIFLSHKSDLLYRRVTLHYLIVTRLGTLFSWGISSQCIHPIHDIHSIQTIYGPSFSEVDCIDDRRSGSGVYKTMLNIKISHQMCPYSYLIVYFMTSEGEFVVANKRIDVNDCFVNKVTKQWIPNTVSPSSSVKLHVNSNGPALCLFDVTNTALQHIAPTSPVYKDVIGRLNQFIDARFKRIQRDNTNMCFAEQSTELNDEPLIRLYGNILRSFHETGLELISDIMPDSKPCFDYKHVDQTPEPYYSSQNAKSKERSYFPETWLWEVLLMDSTGSLDLTAIVPDEITTWDGQVYCISRHGFATSYTTPESTLKVFRPFFINLSIPSVIKRGESIQVYYQIYNYLDYSVPVQSNVKISPHSAAQIIINNSNNIVCIPSKQSHIVYFTVKAKYIGHMKVSVHAQIRDDAKKPCARPKLPIFISYDTRDHITKEILIEPEGIPVENHKSAILCTDDVTNKTEISWIFERNHCVNGSEKWFVSFVGDIAGPMSMNVDKLVSMPMGCGEQNMVHIAYNLIALEYSILKKKVSRDLKENAIHNLMSGYQKQLRYRHPDTGAFSAFGVTDHEGSTWLTAFCVKYLSLLKHKRNIGAGNDVIESAAAWLLDKQMENGCFSNEGHVFHNEFKGGLYSETSNTALAAYIAVSLIDAKLSFVKPSVFQNVLYCLEAQKYNRLGNDTMYSFTLTTLAKLKIEKYFNNIDKGNNTLISFQRNHIFAENRRYIAGEVALSSLKDYAKSNGELIWWEAGSLSTSIETTAYVVLSLLEIGGNDNILTAMSAVKWLSMHRNHQGGFKSTQDTLIGIEALRALSNALPDDPPSMSIIIDITDRRSYLTVNPIERYRLHTIMTKSIDSVKNSPTKLNVQAYGKGCVLMQATQRYNKIYDDAENNSFNLFIKTSTNGAFDCNGNEAWCKCAVALEVCVSWNSPTGVTFPDMAILEVEFPTGYSSDRTLLYKLLTLDNILLKRIEESASENKIFMYLSPSSKLHSLQPKECYNLYVIGAKSHTLPATVKVYDYYHPDVSQSTTYSIAEDCPFIDINGPHNEPVNHSKNDKYADSAELSDVTDVMSDFHIIDTDDDLEVPKTIEGVPPVYVLPPKDFDVSKYSGITNIYTNKRPIQSFENWTRIDSETDLEFSDRRR